MSVACRWRFLLLVAALSAQLACDRQAMAQPVKCSIGGKITYTDGPCPSAAKQEPLRRRAGAPAALPKLQSGLWKAINRSNQEEFEVCGDPLDKYAEALARASKFGCTRTFASPKPQTITAVVECPADRTSPDGSTRIYRGRTEISVELASPQLMTLTLAVNSSRENYRTAVAYTRVRDCSNAITFRPDIPSPDHPVVSAPPPRVIPSPSTTSACSSPIDPSCGTTSRESGARRR